MEAAEVIARASYAHDPIQTYDRTSAGLSSPLPWEEVVDWYRENHNDRADRILAALREAGYEVTRREPTPDPMAEIERAGETMGEHARCDEPGVRRAPLMRPPRRHRHHREDG